MTQLFLDGPLAAMATAPGAITGTLQLRCSKNRRGVNIRLKFLIGLFLPVDRAEETLTGLEDVYVERWRPRYGRGLATFICSCHVVATIISFHWERSRS